MIALVSRAKYANSEPQDETMRDSSLDICSDLTSLNQQ